LAVATSGRSNRSRAPFRGGQTLENGSAGDRVTGLRFLDHRFDDALGSTLAEGIQRDKHL
jgi:hypothetical protein